MTSEQLQKLLARIRERQETMPRERLTQLETLDAIKTLARVLDWSEKNGKDEVEESIPNGLERICGQVQARDRLYREGYVTACADVQTIIAVNQP